MHYTINIILILSVFTLSCNEHSNNSVVKKSTPTIINDSKKSITPFIEVHTVLERNSDTLKIVSCSDYVYSPFGTIFSKNDIENSVLKNCEISEKTQLIDDVKYKFINIKKGGNKLILYLDRGDLNTKSSYVFKGEIKDSLLSLDYNIRVGLNKTTFLQYINEKFTKEEISRFNCVVIESCVQDILHVYNFKNDLIESINFKSDSYWTVDY